MACKQKTVDYLLDQLQSAGEVSAKKMFGDYALYYQGKVIAFICDDQFFVKPTERGKAFANKCDEGYPYPGAKPCLLIAPDQWEDADWLVRLIQLTAADLPLPKAKKTKIAK